MKWLKVLSYTVLPKATVFVMQSIPIHINLAQVTPLAHLLEHNASSVNSSQKAQKNLQSKLNQIVDVNVPHLTLWHIYKAANMNNIQTNCPLNLSYQRYFGL